MNGTESCSTFRGQEPARSGEQHPAPGDQYRGPAGGGLVLVDGTPQPGGPVPVERMDSGVHCWIPRPAFDAAYQLAIPRTSANPGVLA